LQFPSCLPFFAALLLCAGCDEAISTFGRPGLGDGEFREPRALTAGPQGIAVVDRSGRLQRFDLDGVFRGKFAVAPETARKGLPCGVTWLADGTLAVADTHQGHVRIYTPDGETVGHVGTFGAEPGQFHMPQRIAQDASGRLIVTDFGTGICNRVQVLSKDGVLSLVFGGPEPAQGGLQRPMGVVPLAEGGYVVADQVAGLLLYDAAGGFTGPLGGRPAFPGAVLNGLCRGDDGSYYTCDLAGGRVCRAASDGRATGTFGRAGSEPGQFLEPWDVAWFRGRLYVADKGNHRVQSIDPGRVRWE
jgi:sugar lactone lactonase YvrE